MSSSLEGKPMTIGETLVACLVDLLPLNDTAIQLKALELILFCVHPPVGFLRMHGEMVAAASGVNADDAADPATHGNVPLVSEGGPQDSFGLYATTLFLTLDGCFRLSVATSHSGVQISSYGVLTTLLRRAVRTFSVEALPNPLGATTIAIGGSSEMSFVSDVSPSAPFVPLQFFAVRKDRPNLASLAVVASGGFVPDDELAEKAIADIFLHERCIPLRDLIVIVKGLCLVGCRPLPPGASDEQSESVKARTQALRLLYLILEEMPVANHECEHPSAYWVALVVESCKYELLKTVGRSLATAAPVHIFTVALDVLRLLLHKVHYHIHDELHATLNTMLFPLMRSRVSSASQKLSFLHMMRSIVSTPHLLVAYFINYDCSIGFDASSPGGGFVSSIMDTLVSIPYVAYHKSSSSNNALAGGSDDSESLWCSEEQQTMICTEVIRVMHDLVLSLKRWTYDDPRAYNKLQDAEAIGSVARNFAVEGSNRAVATELHLDDWSDGSSSTASDEHDLADFKADDASSVDGDFATGASSDPTQNTHDDVNNTSMVSTQEVLIAESDSGGLEPGLPAGVLGSNLPAAFSPQKPPHELNGQKCVHTFSLPGTSAKKKAHPIAYHWKHVHMNLHNRRLLDEAVAKTNSNWRMGRSFLVEKHILSSDKDYTGFARFLREHPAIEKSLLCSIFERVNKDPECVRILEAYLSTFSYVGVPIDIALRDTTCEFMSWDRPQFEAQTWERIQSLFGATYASQNPGYISEVDADVMAGVLLFLHTSLHNQNVKQQSKMTREQFIRDGGACMESPLPVEEMKAMFDRVYAKRWALDTHQRTPRQQELLHEKKHAPYVPRSLVPFLRKVASNASSRITAVVPVTATEDVSETATSVAGEYSPTSTLAPLQQQVSAGFDNNTSTLAESDANNSSMGTPIITDSVVLEPKRQTSIAIAASTAPAFLRPLMSPQDSAIQSPLPLAATTALLHRRSSDASESILASTTTLFESTFDSYTDNGDRMRHKVEHELRYAKTAMLQLAKLEAEHRRIAVSTSRNVRHVKPGGTIPTTSAAVTAPSPGVAAVISATISSATSASSATEAVAAPFVLSDLQHQAPYLAPHYAQHIQPMFLAVYPHVVAVCYVGLRTLKQEPILRLVLDMYQNLFDVAAAFCININQLQGVTERLIQKCLRQDNAIEIGPENIRASVTPYLMNQL